MPKKSRLSDASQSSVSSSGSSRSSIITESSMTNSSSGSSFSDTQSLSSTYKGEEFTPEEGSLQNASVIDDMPPRSASAPPMPMPLQQRRMGIPEKAAILKEFANASLQCQRMGIKRKDLEVSVEHIISKYAQQYDSREVRELAGRAWDLAVECVKVSIEYQRMGVSKANIDASLEHFISKHSQQYDRRAVCEIVGKAWDMAPGIMSRNRSATPRLSSNSPRLE